MLGHIPFPALPAPPSWYPGHMGKFARMLPALLRRTDVVLELRDSRLPLTSINETLEGSLRKWRRERGKTERRPASSYPSSSSMDHGRNAQPQDSLAGSNLPCERIVVFNKRDLVPEWGMEPFRRAMVSKFPDQKIFFASWHRSRDIKTLNEMLVKVAREYPSALELNVLVVGMPNVGKSTLLNALRNDGIQGPTPKALRTSPHPGHTISLSTRLKLSVDPLVYSWDSPGVMLPFLGKGDHGAERGIKLALIAGIKQGLYDVEALAAYLLYRLNILDPVSPAYLDILPESASPTTDIEDFLDQLAVRLGMLQRGGVRDVHRAAVWFVDWWREGGALRSASASLASSSSDQRQPPRQGWGFDFEWSTDKLEGEDDLQRRMEECIEAYVLDREMEEKRGAGISSTQEKKKNREEKLAKRAAHSAARYAAKRASKFSSPKSHSSRTSL